MTIFERLRHSHVAYAPHSVQVLIEVERRLLRKNHVAEATVLLMRTHKKSNADRRIYFLSFNWFYGCRRSIVFIGPYFNSHALAYIEQIHHRIICRLWNHLTTQNNINVDCIDCRQTIYIRRKRIFWAVHMLCFTLMLFPISFSFSPLWCATIFRRLRFTCVYWLLSQHIYIHIHTFRSLVAFLSHLLIYLNTHKQCTLNASFGRCLALPQSKPPLFTEEKKNKIIKDEKRHTEQSTY